MKGEYGDCLVQTPPPVAQGGTKTGEGPPTMAGGGSCTNRLFVYVIVVSEQRQLVLPALPQGICYRSGADLPPQNWSKSDVSLGPQRRAKWPEGDTRRSR